MFISGDVSSGGRSSVGGGGGFVGGSDGNAGHVW